MMRSVKRNLSVIRTLFTSSLFFFIFMAGLLASTQAWAAPVGLNEYFCAEDIKNVGNCTANEVSLSGVTGVTITNVAGDLLTSCYDGQLVKIATLNAELDNNTGQRWDIAFWVGRYGNDPRTPAGGDPTACAVRSLPDDGTGAPWIADDDGDFCFDFAIPDAPVPLSFGGSDATFECRDSNNDGIADLQVLTTWDQQATVLGNPNKGFFCGAGNQIPPYDINDPVFEPGAPSKCDITTLDTVPLATVASLTVTKVSQGGVSTFGFAGAGFPSGTTFDGVFTLDTTNPTPGTASLTDPIIILNDPINGDTFTITEAVPVGWNLANATCSNGDDPQVGVTLLPNDDVTCTFTDVADGSVTIIKNTIGGDATFSYTSNTLPIPATFNILTTAGSGSASTTGLLPGTYNVTETPLAGWDLTDLSCQDPNGNSTVDIITGTVTINLDAGETITCTYENTARGQIDIIKATTPSSTNIFEFSHDVVGNTVPASPFDLAAGTPQSFLEVLPGSYQITETDPTPAYDLNDIICLDGVGNVVDSSVDIIARTATVNVDPGETVQCQFFNIERGSLTVVKQLSVDGPSPVGDFDFISVALGDFQLSPVDAATPASTTFSDILSNTYDLAESDPFAIGWELISATCNDGTDLIDPEAANPGTVFLNPGQDLICTFVNAPLGSSTIIKTSVGADDLFVFTGTAQNGATNPMDGLNLNTVAGTAQADFSYQLSPNGNPFTVTEEPIPAGWELTDIVCTEDGTQDSTVDIPNATADINVDLAEAVTCTFTNTADASLVIQKATLPTGLTDAFTFTSDGVTTWDGSLAVTTALMDTESDSQTGQPGVYEATETVLPGFAVTDISCSGETLSTIVIGDGASPGFDDGDTSVEVTLAAGETVTCVYENTALGSIEIVKDTLGDDGSFLFSSPQLGGFQLDTVANTATTTFSDLLPGDYMIGETVNQGWDLTDLTCIGETGTTYNYTNPSVTVSLADGDNIVCTFTNTQQGNIVVDKVTDPTGSTQSFEFSSSYGAGFNLTDAGTPNDSGLLTASSVAGTYSVVESAVTGWDLTTATCDDGSDPGAIDLGPGETVTCTFTNTIQRGNIVVDKVTSPLGSAQSFDFVTNYGSGGFSLTDGAAPNDSGDLLPTSESATYSVTEDPVTGWTQTGVVCNGNVGGAKTPTAIDLMPGETVICTFTNTVAPGKILVDKITVPAGSSQSFAFVTNYGIGGFSLTDADAPNDSGDLIPSAESGGGLYSVVESPTAGWTETGVVCNGDVGGAKTPGAIELLPTETVTCTFTNTIQPGQIIVDKQTAPTGSAQLFSFTLTGTGVNQGFDLADATTPHNSGDLLPTSENGTYNVSETLPTDWSQVSATCSDGSLPSAVDVSAGEVVTCTFLNAEAGTSTFTKVSVGGDDTFGFTSDTPSGDFSLTTANGISPATPLTGLTAGTYTIVESALAGWDLTNLVCTESETQDSTTDIPTRTVTLRVQEGETINCTVTNTKQGSITVSKVTVPTGDPASFTFTGDAAGSISDGGTIVVSDLAPGAYTSVEGALAGWDLTDIQCDDGASTTPSSGDVGTMTATFNLDAGEDVVCTFTNTLKPLINLAKTVTSGPTLEANGTYTVVYSIAATNTGGPGTYDVVDTFSPGAGITLNSANAVYVAGSENSQSGAQGAYPNFVTGEDLEAGLNESWTVTANFTVNPATLDPATSSCDPATPVVNTGFYNYVVGSVTDTDLTDNDACTGLADPIINLAKTVNGPAELQGDGSYNVIYTITATNTGGPGVYNLVDTFSPGAGITLNTATAAYLAGTESTQTGTLGVYPNFVTTEGLAEGLNESWTITANFAVDPALLDMASSSCALEGTAINTGFYNYVEGSVTDPDLSDNDACTGLEDPVINLAKTVASGPTLEVDGTYTVVYTIAASNTGGPGAYDITDTMSPGTGITVVSDATYPGLVYAGGETQTGVIEAPPLANPGTWVTAEGLGEGASETWTVTASFTVDPELLDPATSSCDPASPVINTGFYNYVEGSVTDADLTDNETCTGLDGPLINLAKTVDGPATLEADGTYTVVYTITATNTGGPGVYDIIDTLSPGTGITVVADATYPGLVYAGGETQTGVLAAPPLTNGGTWVTNEALGAAASETWTVTASFTVDPATVDPATSSCDPAAPVINTGFYNAITGSDSDGDVTDNATCTSLPFASMTVVKLVNGGTALPSDFALTLTGVDGVHDSGVDYVSGDQPAVQVGIAYTLSEVADQLPDYTDAGVSCVDDDGNTAVPHPVTLSDGQSVTCTQTNTFGALPPIEILPVPVNDKLALLLLTLMMLASGWYFRPAVMRKF